jgi:HEPN domain-containing protein
MKRPLDQAEALLRKAANDLIAADVTLATERALDTVCFHAQQAAEKSLKAILALHDISYPWRHDLGELLDLVAPLAPELAPYADRIVALTPYAVATRYDTEFSPELAEAERAFGVAVDVFDLCSQLADVDTGAWLQLDPGDRGFES